MSTVVTPETRTVWLWQGDDLARIEELHEAFLSAVNQNLPRSLGELDPAEAAAKAHDDFVTEAKGRAVRAVMTAIGRKKLQALLDANPPRPGNVRDDALGFNEETLADDLVPVCLVEPALSGDALEAFLDSLSHKNYQRLYSAAAAVNLLDTADPKADLGSRLGQTSATS